MLALHCELAGLPARELGRSGRRGRSSSSAWPIAPATASAPSRRACSSASGSASALLGEPDLVILDEPTSALDPVGRQDVRAIVRGPRDAAAAVFLNSHLLGEVERVCDRVAIVDHGRVVARGTLDEVLGESEPSASASTGLAPADLARDRAPFGPLRSGRRLAGRDRPMDATGCPDLVAAIVAIRRPGPRGRAGRESLEERFLEPCVRAADEPRRARS